MHCIRIVLGKRILICGDNYATRRIEGRWQLVEWDEALPLELARASFDRHVTGVVFANRQAARSVISDVTVDVSVNKVRTRSRQPAQSCRELLPVSRAIDIDKRVLKRA